MRRIVLWAGLSLTLWGARAAEVRLAEEAARALHQGVEFFRTEVAVQGTYVWQYSADLAKREGEGKTSATEGWVQPPGTPAVGLALLNAFEATRDSFYLEAARETARGLIRGQLDSGGWCYYIEFGDEPTRPALAYRKGSKGRKTRHVTTLDDDTTQAALRFLLKLDAVLKFADAELHDSIAYALEALFKAQYPNGAWPQGYAEFPDPAAFPVKRASFPESWSRTWPGSQQYWLRYTLNDNVLANMIEMLFLAERTYAAPAAERRFDGLARAARAAAEKAGGFILLAQMPEPQPAWAQQYDFQMHPAWARKFEPPAVTGGESQGMIRTLLRLYRETGDGKYLEPIPRALAYLKRSELKDGRLARFYELESNRPLYFTMDYHLTYDDGDMPTHYSFKVPGSVDSLARQFERTKRGAPGPSDAGGAKVPSEAEVRGVIEAQDQQGRWVEAGPLRYQGPNDDTEEVIRCATFIRNVNTLSEYLGARARTEVRQP